MKRFLLNTRANKIAVVLFLLFFSSLYVYAVSGGPFNPGETLDPDCTPGATNCLISNPYLKLDQTTPQNITGGAPLFEGGLKAYDSLSIKNSSGDNILSSDMTNGLTQYYQNGSIFNVKSLSNGHGVQMSANNAIGSIPALLYKTGYNYLTSPHDTTFIVGSVFPTDAFLNLVSSGMGINFDLNNEFGSNLLHFENADNMRGTKFQLKSAFGDVLLGVDYNGLTYDDSTGLGDTTYFPNPTFKVNVNGMDVYSTIFNNNYLYKTNTFHLDNQGDLNIEGYNFDGNGDFYTFNRLSLNNNGLTLQSDQNELFGKIDKSNKNTFMGYYAGNLTMAGTNNTAVGSQALENNTSGYNNTANGLQALLSNDTGNENSAFGVGSLWSNTEGSYNTAVGNGALVLNIKGGNNTAIGNSALYSNIASSNTAIGVGALESNTNGSGNVAIGIGAFSFNVSGSNNTAVGYGADTTGVNVNNLTNATAIGYNAKVGANNSLVLGGTGSYTVKVGIGTTTPSQVLNIVGKTGDTTVFRIETIGGNGCNFDTTQSTGTFACSSDERLKNNINSISNDTALNKLLALNPVTFHYNWQKPDEPMVAGFIAQEYQNVFPELVSTDQNGYLMINQALTPYMVKAIQDLDLKITNINDLTKSNDFRDSLVTWFSNAKNKITEFVAGIIRAKDKICIGEGNDEVCITKEELLQMKNNLNKNNTVQNSESVVLTLTSDSMDSTSSPKIIQDINASIPTTENSITSESTSVTPSVNSNSNDNNSLN